MADEYRMLIAGEWIGSQSGATFEATSPSTGEVIGTLPEGTREDVRRGVAAAIETNAATTSRTRSPSTKASRCGRRRSTRSMS
jgi:acyl-CoA reductase-like NAD-dependent aldehyde dehydrogenase